MDASEAMEREYEEMVEELIEEAAEKYAATDAQRAAVAMCVSLYAERKRLGLPVSGGASEQPYSWRLCIDLVDAARARAQRDLRHEDAEVQKIMDGS